MVVAGKAVCVSVLCRIVCEQYVATVQRVAVGQLTANSKCVVGV